MKRLLLLLALSFSGCLYPISFPKHSNTPDRSITVETDIVADVKDRTKSIPKEDAQVLYKLFTGYALLIENCDPSTTLDSNNHFERAKKVYGWPDNKYPEINDIIEDYTIGKKQIFGNVDMSIPQEVAPIKSKLLLLFNSLAEGVYRE